MLTLADFLDNKNRINARPFDPVVPREMRESDQQNGDLDFSKYYFARVMNGRLDPFDTILARSLIRSFSPGGVLMLEHKSHDNYTGMMALAKRLNLKLFGYQLDADRSYHPRSTAFYDWVLRGEWIGLLFICIANLFTCMRHYKVRNGEKIVKTDNEILMILMYQAGLNRYWICRVFGYLCHKLLVRRFSENIYYGMIILWYRDQEWHPVKDEWKKIPANFKWWCE